MKHTFQMLWSFEAFVYLGLMTVIISCQPQDYSASLKPITDQYTQAWNTGDFAGFENFVHPDVVRTTSPTANGGAVGIDSLKSVITDFRNNFPDMKVVITDEIFAKDRAVARWTVSATGLDGQATEFSGTSTLRLSEGKIVEDMVDFDNLHLMTQLGYTLMPPAGPLENDAVEVDPDHYSVAFENERVRVVRIKYGPKEKSVMHAHRGGVTVAFDDSKGVMTLPDGSTVESDLKARSVNWAPAGAHQPENATNKPFELVLVELK